MVSRNFKRFENHLYKLNDNISLLKTSMIYGSNGSGKTNLFKAIYLVKKMVINPNFLRSFQARNIIFPYSLNENTSKEPIQIQIDFTNNNKVYSYEIVLHSTNRILFESLSLINDKEDKIIFKRQLETNAENNLQYESFNKHIDLLMTQLDRNPYTSILSQDFIDDEHLLNAQDWFQNKVKFQFPEDEVSSSNIRSDDTDLVYTLSLNPKYLRIANDLIKFSKLGISELKIEPVDTNVSLAAHSIEQITKVLERQDYYSYRDSFGDMITAFIENDQLKVVKLFAVHDDDHGNKVPFKIDQESRGTKLIIRKLLPAIIQSYGEGVTYFIDEINRGLHPVYIRELIQQYLSNISEHTNGQLIFNTHEDFIMDEKMLRQDEIWFAEKIDEKRSELFPLTDYNNVRFDLNLRKNYLNGKFGGVPFSDNPNKVNFNV